MTTSKKARFTYPPYLESYGSLLSHLENQFEGLIGHEKADEKGDRFVEFTVRLVPHLEIAQRFERPRRNKKKTHDKGVDLIANSLDGSEVLLIQSKYSIPEVKEVDSIISKFQNYDAERRGVPAGAAKTGDLFEGLYETGAPVSHFMIVTTTDMKAILQKYERSQMASRAFYDKLKSSNRLHIIDGPSIFPILRDAYRKQHVLPTGLELNLARPFIHLQPVYVGIIAGSELKKLYNKYGNALFLENIREFLGQISGRISPSIGQIPVNKEIAKTLQDEPHKFLEKNNGITFRAAHVKVTGEQTLLLDEASIVNGCQTTMSIVHNLRKESHVLVKIVEATNTWDIAEAANFQNEIKQLDLRLARYIRPQEIRGVANKSNVAFKSPSEEASAFAMLDTFYQNEITYEEVRALFIGLFSKTPNNAIDTNYTKLHNQLIQQVFESNEDKEKTFDILFNIHKVTQEASKDVQRLYPDKDIAELFQRFWRRDDKPNYRVFLAILTACGCAQRNIYDSNTMPTYETMMKFLSEVQSVIDKTPELFIRYYRNAFLVVAFEVVKPDSDPDKLVHTMFRSIDQSDFRNLYSRLKTLSRNDERLVEIEKTLKTED